MNDFFIVFPKTVDEAVSLLEPRLTRREKTHLANASLEKLTDWHRTMDPIIRTEYRLPGNTPLLTSCLEYARKEKLTKQDSTYIILYALWKKLQSSNFLKIVK